MSVTDFIYPHIALIIPESPKISSAQSSAAHTPSPRPSLHSSTPLSARAPPPASGMRGLLGGLSTAEVLGTGVAVPLRVASTQDWALCRAHCMRQVVTIWLARVTNSPSFPALYWATWVGRQTDNIRVLQVCYYSRYSVQNQSGGFLFMLR